MANFQSVKGKITEPKIYDFCGFKFNKRKVHVTLGVAAAAFALDRYFEISTKVLKPLADYYLINPSIFLPLIFAETGMTLLGMMILHYSASTNPTQIMLMKCATYYFGLMTLMTVALDVKYD